jgi:hypothetical protein
MVLKKFKELKAKQNNVKVKEAISKLKKKMIFIHQQRKGRSYKRKNF